MPVFSSGERMRKRRIWKAKLRQHQLQRERQRKRFTPQQRARLESEYRLLAEARRLDREFEEMVGARGGA